ncbi:hypothetical protein MP638_007192 [Amoeboaphelidium occidentale]|nr:hypothetical protein MP638_007192 [Amoeboaphelidium occidentale]
MADEENRWKWDKFVEIGNTIHKMRGQVRTEKAQDALMLARALRRTEYLIGSKERFELYETLLHKIAEYLDGNAEVIQAAVREHFLAQHCKSGLDESLYDISFAPKRSGVQTGFICHVSNGTQTARYFIKTHQYGPTEDNPKSLKSPDTKELFVYKLLHYIGIGPQVQFIIPSHGTKRTIYIATKDCCLTLLSNLTKETVNNTALLQLDLISRILCLRDCTTNSSNCGQVGDKAMIVDFRIEKLSWGYAKPDIVAKFCEGNSEFHYSGLMEAAVKTPKEVKMDIMKKSLQEWKLLESIERVGLEIVELVKRCDGKMQFEDDLHNYVKDVKETVDVLMKS